MPRPFLVFAFALSVAHLTAGAARAEDCDIVSEGQFGRIALCASSVLAPQSGNTYLPANMTDGDPATAWVEAAPGDGVGEWIEYRFDGAMRFQTLEIVAGYAKSPSTFTNNTRPRDIRIYADGAFVQAVRLADTMSAQRIRLSAPVEVQSLRLVFMSTNPGLKWPDLAVSEFFVDLEELNYQSD